MRPRVSQAAEWKLNRFGEIQIDGMDPAKLPVAQKVRVLIAHQESMDSTWRAETKSMRDSTNTHYKPGFKRHNNFTMPPQLDRENYRRTRIDDDIVEELREVHNEEEPLKAELDLSFDDRLNMVLECYNLYAAEMGIGWE